MIDLKATNKKLQQRSRNIIRGVCELAKSASDEELDTLLLKCGGSVKLAVASILLQAPIPEAAKYLQRAEGVLANALAIGNTAERQVSAQNGLDQNEYVLCVDGGGSKCAAVVLGSNGDVGRGEAGGCNV